MSNDSVWLRPRKQEREPLTLERVVADVTGSATTQAREQSATALDEHLRAQRDTYPTLAAHGLGHDWDDTFARGLGYLLDGMHR
ncbi:MAG TPA: hypothetical protein VM347_31860 [Nonomuraea sp.]|nr:hypothetical protein [Nonomuraea sp.]